MGSPSGCSLSFLGASTPWQPPRCGGGGASRKGGSVQGASLWPIQAGSCVQPCSPWLLRGLGHPLYPAPVLPWPWPGPVRPAFPQPCTSGSWLSFSPVSGGQLSLAFPWSLPTDRQRRPRGKDMPASGLRDVPESFTAMLSGMAGRAMLGVVTCGVSAGLGGLRQTFSERMKCVSERNEVQTPWQVIL